VREVETPRQPLRVIVDRYGDTPARARVFGPGQVLVFTATPPRTTWPPHVETTELPDRHGRIDLAAMLDVLGKREINELHVEAGAKLAGALLAAGLVDELLVYMAPCLLGDPARGMFDLPVALTSLEDRFALRVRSVDRVGEDWRILARIAAPSR